MTIQATIKNPIAFVHYEVEGEANNNKKQKKYYIGKDEVVVLSNASNQEKKIVVNFVNKEYKELRGAVFKYYHTNAVEESMKPESPLRLLLLSSFIVGLLLSEHLMPIIVLVLACSSLKCLKGRVIICIPSSVCYTLETFAMMIV